MASGPRVAHPPVDPSTVDTRGVRDATGQPDGLAGYAIERAIGRGHFSTVHKAIHALSGRPVAIKRIQIFDSMDAKSRDRCLKEVELLQSLDAHPSIIEYIDAFLDSNELYIVFEWAAHGDLRRLMRKAQEANVLFDESHIWRYFVQIVDAVRHMHAHRVMHRDIKPANIFLSADGAVKLGDLGLGRAFSEQTFEAVSKVGTPLYMSPEVLDGRGYEWKSDVWSLGVLLYELAALRSPFKADGDNLYMLFQKISKGAFAPIPPNFSNGLRETIRAMLHVEPTRRPDVSSVLAMAKAAAAETAAAAAAAAAAATAEHGGGDDGGGGGDTEAGSDVYLVMEAALDKLKLLEYERSAFWKAERARSATGSARDLERSHFAQRASDGRAQFLAFCRLMDWLGTSVCASASDVLRLAPASPSAASFETHALAAATAILELLERLAASLGGAGSEGGARALLRTLSAHKLAVGSGLDVCLALNLALDAALLATRFEWRPARVAEADDDGGAADVAAADGGGGAAGTQLGADWASGSDDDDATASNGAPSAPSASVAPPVYARVSAERWLAEAERLAPALRLAFRAADAARARAGGGSERELRGRALRAELAPWADALETVERLAAARAAEVSAHAASLLPQALTAREAAAALAARAETVEAASSALAERAAELRALEAQLAAVKAALDERSAELDGGGGRLAALKRAVRDVGAETNALGTRLATVQAQLAHRALAALAAAPRASAARGASAAALPRATVGRQPPSLPSPARAAAGYVSHPPAAASGARPTSGRR